MKVHAAPIVAVTITLFAVSVVSVSSAQNTVPTSPVPSPAAAASQSASTSTIVSIPDGTIVLVHTTTALSSSQNQPDDVFDVVVEDPVSVDGFVIIKRNAAGRGHVVKVDPAGGHGHPGSVVIVLDYVYSIDGLRLRLRSTPITQEGAKAQGGAAIAGFLTYGIASNAVKGGDATIEPTRIMTSRIDGNVHVTSNEKTGGSGTEDGYAK